jgi:hypothetical protein
MEIHVCHKRHYHSEGMPQTEVEVLVEGVRYRCDERALAMLYDGVCLDEIDMQRVDDEH